MNPFEARFLQIVTDETVFKTMSNLGKLKLDK